MLKTYPKTCDNVEKGQPENFSMQRLKYDNRYVYCEGNAFVIKDENDEVVETISIEQNEDGIDTENRIEKYLSTPKSL